MINLIHYLIVEKSPFDEPQLYSHEIFQPKHAVLAPHPCRFADGVSD